VIGTTRLLRRSENGYRRESTSENARRSNASTHHRYER